MAAPRKDVPDSGYDNWETGEMILWLSNEEPTYLHCMEMAKKIKNKNALGRAIKRWIGPGRYKSLTAHDMRRVRWESVAESFLEE